MNDWIFGNLRITQSTLRIVEQAAVNAYARSEEACGYLQGPANVFALCDAAVELENLANKYHAVDPEGHPRTGRDYFKINSMKFEKAITQGQQDYRPIKVFFHSHLDCGAYFSDEDAASMTGDGASAPAYDLAYLVTAVDQGAVTAHKLFIWAPATSSFVESWFEVING